MGKGMITALSFTEVGGHALNEDAFALHQHPLEPAMWFCFVADGQGGRAGGGRAAQIACATAIECVAKYPPESWWKLRTWSSLFRMVDEAVLADPVAGFTTFVGLCVIRDRVIGISSGDSAAVVVTGGVSVDLTARQHKNPPCGSGVAEGTTFEASLIVPWRLLAMTDGVWKYVGWERVTAATRQELGSEVVAELQQSARLRGSGLFQDDFTVVLLEEVGPNATAG